MIISIVNKGTTLLSNHLEILRNNPDVEISLLHRLLPLIANCQTDNYERYEQELDFVKLITAHIENTNSVVKIEDSTVTPALLYIENLDFHVDWSPFKINILKYLLLKTPQCIGAPFLYLCLKKLFDMFRRNTTSDDYRQNVLMKSKLVLDALSSCGVAICKENKYKITLEALNKDLKVGPITPCNISKEIIDYALLNTSSEASCSFLIDTLNNTIFKHHGFPFSHEEPKKLQLKAAHTIRSCLGSNKEKEVNKLKLPPLLLDYVITLHS